MGTLSQNLVDKSPRLWSDGSRSFRPPLPPAGAGARVDGTPALRGWSRRWVQNVVRHVGKLAMACQSSSEARARIELQGQYPVSYGQYVALRLRLEDIGANVEMHSAQLSEIQ